MAEKSKSEKLLEQRQEDQAEAVGKLTETLKDSNPKFREMFKNLGDIDAELSNSLAYSKQTTQNTFAGVLQSRKGVRLTESFNASLKLSVDDMANVGDEFSELEQFLGADLTNYKEAMQKERDVFADRVAFNVQAEAEQAEIANNQKNALNRIKSREAKIDEIDKAEAKLAADKLTNTDKVSLLEAELAEISENQYTGLNKQAMRVVNLKFTALNKELEEETKIQEAQEAKWKTDKETHEKANKSNKKQQEYYENRLEQIDKDIDASEETHDKAIEAAEKERDNIDNKLSAIEQDEGRFGQFSDGIKKLTGIDLAGYADDMVEGINAVGKVFGMENLAESIFSGIGAMLAPLGTMLAAASAPFIAGFKKIILNMWKHVKKMIPVIVAFIAASIAFVVSLWTSISAMAAAALAIIAPVLPFLLIGLAIIALAALLIWGGMWLYENSEVFRNAIDAVVGYFMDIVGIIGDIFGGFYDFFAGLFTGDFDRMFGGLEDIFGGLWDLILAPFRAISSFLKDTFGIDIGAWLTDKLRDWLPGWALKLLGMGGSEDTDALQAGLVDEVDKSKQKEDLASAKESGLYDENWKGDSTIDKEKMADATDDQLQAIMRDNDISDEDRQMVLETLNQRQIAEGGPDVAEQIAAAKEEGLSGADLATRTAELKDAETTATDTNVTSNVVQTTDNSTNNNLNVAKNARETDSTLGRVSSSGYAFGPFGPDPA